MINFIADNGTIISYPFVCLVIFVTSWMIIREIFTSLVSRF